MKIKEEKNKNYFFSRKVCVNILLCLNNNNFIKKPCLNDIKKKIGTTISSTSKDAAILLALRLIKTETDGRRVFVEITPKGKIIAEKLQKMVERL